MTKTEIRIENHNPVPLRPLRDVLKRESDTYTRFIYIEHMAWDEGSGEEVRCWVAWDTSDNTYQYMEDIGETMYGEMLDHDLTTARELQPGEKLVLTIFGG